jgi:8-oxo-dGTP pyrophosphatase MutT (NUDIX family)
MVYDWGSICNRRDLRRYTPFVASGFHLGWINRDRLDLLRTETTFRILPDVVVMDEDLRTPAERTARLAELAARWRDQGVVPGWRDELYDIVPFPGGPVVMRMERAVTRLFGVINRGAHINGFVRAGDDVLMWVARRAVTKPTFPGRLDQMVAGGMTASMTPDTLARKEAWEEAGVGAELAGAITSVSAVTMFMEHGDVILRDVDYVFDLELPADFVPRPVDSEVSEFELHPVDKIFDMVTNSNQFKPDCNLVILDFLIRHEHIRPEDPLFERTVLGVRRGV